MLCKLFHKIEREGTTKPIIDKKTAGIKKYRPIFLLNIDAKFSPKYLQTEFNYIV
jgi:hypothetical protein